MKTFGLCVAVLAAAVLTAPFAAARPDAAAKHAVIRSVAFEMLEGEAPVVILHGSGFGIQPTPSPAYRPTPPNGNKPPYSCTATGKVGFDYGTRLWISFTSPNHDAWTAGRYRPGVHELDCVGIRLLTYSPTQVVYRLGSGYRALGFKLQPGDRFTASLNGALKRGTVS